MRDFDLDLDPVYCPNADYGDDQTNYENGRECNFFGRHGMTSDNVVKFDLSVRVRLSFFIGGICSLVPVPNSKLC